MIAPYKLGGKVISVLICANVEKWTPHEMNWLGYVMVETVSNLPVCMCVLL